MGTLLVNMIKGEKKLRVTGWLRHSVIECGILLLGHWFSPSRKDGKA